MANRLAGETSPYLLQHAQNPVDWFPWGPDALARATLLDRPIFLSIGYAACHWCHVMERESFEDRATADYLNEHFISIKVDREERPDLDQLYMGAVQAMTGGGGWPMSVFLTPEGRPFYGGTYYPDQPRHGMPSFRQVLEGVDRAWRDGRGEVEAAGQRMVEALVSRQGSDVAAEAPTAAIFEGVLDGLTRTFDTRNGSWGGAPKFPQPMTIEYLLRRMAGGDARPGAIARFTLEKMADGGIHDQLGGGFHRYATDAIWLVPHFEQMLYDNAQLARAYLHAWAETGDERFRAVALEVLDYMLRELALPDGAFAASQDADTDGVEGLTFIWTAAEIRDVLGADADPFLAAYGVTDEGNWEGRTILSRVWPDLHTPPDRSDPVLEDALARSRATLLERRATRPQPKRDDKALAAWNGLAIGAFADAGRLLGESRFTDAAVRAAEAILGGLLTPEGALGRSWKDGRASGQGVLEDYTHLAEGLLALYEATFDERWFATARVADGPRARPLRRSRRRVLRHRRRPRAARGPSQGPAGQRGPVGERDGDARPAATGGVDRRGPLSRCRGACAAHGRAVSRALSDRVRPVARGPRPRALPGRRDRDRRRAGGSGHAGVARRDDPRLPAAPGRGGQRRARRARSSRCSPTASRSTASPRPMSAAGSSAGCR